MKCKLNSAIASMSGKCGNVLFKTYKRPNGKTETRAYLLPRDHCSGKFGYKRTTPPSDKEIKARAQFSKFAVMYATLTDEERRSYAERYTRDNHVFNGKKYNTLRGYIIANFYASEKDSVNE